MAVAVGVPVCEAEKEKVLNDGDPLQESRVDGEMDKDDVNDDTVGEFVGVNDEKLGDSVDVLVGEADKDGVGERLCDAVE